MKTSRFTEIQILGILTQAAGGISVPELCRLNALKKLPFINGESNMVAWMRLDLRKEGTCG